ncbi:MAG TPA: glycine cleavage system protein GcvH [Candidatus Acidoferrales bacterium]|nr:glycine cleavage system protein GcvH [Candidatus Acidoferrales bacterium]
MTQPDSYLYSKEHEWLKVDGDVGIIGITDYAQDSLGDIVYVELPRLGALVKQFASVGVIESVKAVSDLFSPVGGEVVEVNTELDADPALVNREPFTGGWLFKLRLADPSQRDGLLSAADYSALVAAEH